MPGSSGTPVQGYQYNELAMSNFGQQAIDLFDILDYDTFQAIISHD